MRPEPSRFRSVTPEQAIAAAVLAAGKGAMASHRSALRLIGVPRPDDDPVDLMFVDRTRGLELKGVVRHRPRDRLDLSPLLRQNVPCSNILRALCDTGAVDPASIPDALQHVVVRGLASPHQLLAALRVHSRQGRAGVPTLREALGEWIVDGKPADRKLESAMNGLLARHGFPPAEFHAHIAGNEVDPRSLAVAAECRQVIWVSSVPQSGTDDTQIAERYSLREL